MPNTIRSPRRIFFFGVVVSLGVLVLALPRPASKAQEPTKPLDKKALRDQIVALHAEIDLLEVDQSTDRETLVNLIRAEKTTLTNQIESVVHHLKHFEDEAAAEKFLSWGGDTWVGLAQVGLIDDDGLRKKLSEPDQELKEYILRTSGQDMAQELESLGKIKDPEEFSRVRQRLASRVRNDVMKKAYDSIREKFDAEKKEFARHSAEIAGKKLDLALLERQYLEAR